MTRTTTHPTATLSTADIAILVRRGRTLHGRAVRDGFASFGRWLLRTANDALGRRATVRLGCSDCGAHA
jgi:hypothetical protein